MPEIENVFEGVVRINRRLATVNMVKGTKVYDEDLIEGGKVEYRTWNPYRSKLAAAIVKGMKQMQIKKGTTVLYLGAATGTTVSHVSDIVGAEGGIFAVELSERNMRELLRVCDYRDNIMPILGDAREIHKYRDDVGSVDVLYMDVSARDQADILLLNSQMLKKGGFAYVAIKSQSISSSRRPEEVFEEFLKKVSQKFDILERIDIDSFDKFHLFAVLRKK